MFVQVHNKLFILFIVLLSTLSFGTTPLHAGTGEDEAEVVYSSTQKELRVKLKETSTATLEVYNLLGSRLMVVSVAESNSRVSLNRLPEGQYVLKLTSVTGKLLAVKKFALY